MEASEKGQERLVALGEQQNGCVQARAWTLLEDMRLPARPAARTAWVAHRGAQRPGLPPICNTICNMSYVCAP